jgi:uncharacterized oxidoreductase
MTIDWTDKTAVVTGGSSGIGQAFASALTASGAKVGITGRDPGRLREAEARRGAAWSLAGNLAHLDDRQALVAKVYSTWPRLDLLINNAGIMLQPNLLDGGESLGRLEEEILTNLVAPIDLSVKLLPLLRASSAAAVVMVSSGYALAPADRAPTYSASKAGLHSFTKSFRRIAASVGVHVLELLPPLVDTPATSATSGKKLSAEDVVRLTLAGLDRRRDEILPGQVRMLPTLLRWLPATAEKMVARR